MVHSKFIYLFTFILSFVSINIKPVYSSISSIKQLGLKPGDIADPESDTLSINPAYGSTVEGARISMNFFNTELNWEHWCLSGKCDKAITATSIIDMHYLQPVSPAFGFFITATPIVRSFYMSNAPDYGYLTGDASAGVWFTTMERLHIGLSVNYLSKKIYEQKGYLNDLERLFNLFSAKAGISMDISDKWNLGYSLLFNYAHGTYSAEGYLWNPYYIASIYPFSTNFAPIFSHELLIRGLLTEMLSLENNFYYTYAKRYNASLNLFNGSSILKIKINHLLFFTGLKYGILNEDTPYLLQRPKTQNFRASLFAGGDIPLLPWLNLRLGLGILNYFYTTFTYFPGESHNHFSFRPQLTGGVLAKLGESLDLEVNFSDTSIQYGTISGNYFPDIALNFQLSYNFSSGRGKSTTVVKPEGKTIPQ